MNYQTGSTNQFTAGAALSPSSLPGRGGGRGRRSWVDKRGRDGGTRRPPPPRFSLALLPNDARGGLPDRQPTGQSIPSERHPIMGMRLYTLNQPTKRRLFPSLRLDAALGGGIPPSRCPFSSVSPGSPRAVFAAGPGGGGGGGGPLLGGSLSLSVEVTKTTGRGASDGSRRGGAPRRARQHLTLAPRRP